MTKRKPEKKTKKAKEEPKRIGRPPISQTGESVHMSIRVSAECKQALAKASGEAGVSPSAFHRNVLTAALAGWFA